MDFARLQIIVLYLPCFLFSLSFHEAAHAWTANRLGDPTARLMGRLSLNPLAHADPVGTILLPLLGILTGWPVLAWARPVPFDPRNLRHPRRDAMWIALAGPVSNIFLAVVFAAAAHALYYAYPAAALVIPRHALEKVYFTMHIAVTLNVSLCLFNFLPVDPLDGGKILRGALSREAAVRFDRFMARNGRVIGMVLIMLILTGVFGGLFSIPVRFVGRLLLGGKYLL